MADFLLWRRLTETDFRAINGKAAPSGSGGGAMHIALGTSGKIGANPTINEFLQSAAHNVTINTEQSAGVVKSKLTFDGNPKRRNGEWRITDQFHHRHPAWDNAHGFPKTYNSGKPPIVFVVRQDGKYFVRYSDDGVLTKDAPTLEALLSANKAKNTGILALSPAWADALDLDGVSDAVEKFNELAIDMEESGEDVFDPENLEDGRERIFAAIVRRQGQQKFRRQLLHHYGKCAVSHSEVEVTLEAAHIVPYKGSATNHVTNGLLLRADLHTLFDLGLISVEPLNYRVKVSPQLAGTEYEEFEGKKLHLPKSETAKPSEAALAQHMKTFQAQKV